MLKLQKKRKAKEKKVWKDQEDRWDHDRYSDDEQAPKSHDELVAAYGYDIRNNEGPPRAGQVNENKTPSEPTNPAWKKESKHNTQNEGPSRSGGGGGDADKSINHKSSPRDTRDKRQVQESVTLAASRARGRGFKGTVDTDNAGSLGLVFKSKGRGSVLPDNRRNNTGDLINKLKRMPVNDGGSFQQENSYPQSPGQVRPGTVPPRMQQQQQQQSPPQQSPRQQQPQQQQQQHDPAGNRPERYSSLRQRPPVPEGPGQQGYQPPHGQHGYHPQAGNSRGVLESQDDYEKVDEYMSNIIENGTSEDGTTHQPITQKTLISDVSDTKSGELQDDEPPKKKRKKNKRDERHKKNKRQKQVSTSSNSATEELSPMSSFNDENKPQNIPTYERSVTGLEPNSDGRDKFSYTQDQHRTANFRSGATTSPTNVTTKQHGINVTARQNQRNGNELLRTPRSNQQRTPGEQGKSSQERILKYLEQISSVVDQNQITLVQLLRMNNAQVHPSIVPHGFPDLPITSLDVFDQFNETLKNEEHRVYLISRLASVGGLSQRQAVMNMLKFTMSNSLAMEYNWAGREKRCFKKTELMQVINEAAKTAFHGKPESSDLNISSAMKDWLKLATTRHTYSITSKKAVQK